MMISGFSFSRKVFGLLSIFLLVLLISGGVSFSQEAASGKHQPIVQELIELLKERPDLEKALETSIRKAELLEVPTLEAYYSYLDKSVTFIPTNRNALSQILEFYYLIDLSPNGKLQKDPLFQQWTVKFAKDWGNYLDTPESANELKTFYDDPAYSIDDYFEGPSGWLTFNQFFGREIRPGKRPIDGRNDDSIVTAPSDSVFHGHWQIDEDSEVTTKGITWSISELLEGSPYKDRFKGGTYMHMFLNVNDYHRHHVPAGGVVKEARIIPGKVVLDVMKKEDGSLDVVDGDSYQFTQARGLIVLDSPVGLVAVLPIGMAQVSSVIITAEVGAELAKGEEFGYFQFGGSDIVVIFEAGKVDITAEIGTHYNVGKQIAKAKK